MRSPAFFFTAVLLLVAFTSPVSSQSRFQYPEAHFYFDLPAEWEKIPDEIVRDYHSKVLKKTGATARAPDMAFQRKSVKSPFDLPYFLINLFEQDVDESIIKEYLSSIKNLPRGEMGDAGRSARGPIITGPSFDGKKKRIKLSIDSIIKDGGKEIEISGYFAIFFFKDGVVAFNFYARRDQLSEHIPVFDTIIDSAAFDKGYEYEPPLFGGTLARTSAIAAGALIVLAFVFWRVWVRRKKKAAAAGEPPKGQLE